MPENTRLCGSIDQIELGFVEREATPKLLVKFGIQPYLAGPSFSNTISILKIFGVERAKSAVYKADLHLNLGRNPDHVAVGETMIRLNGEQY